ncbi:MAG: Uma2 family endonuclease [bacterium]|nr:Uma2 family endonuclease [bacterium]
MGLLTKVDPAVAYPATTPEMGESWLHHHVRVQAYSALRDHFAGRPDCFVGSDSNVYYRPKPRTAYVAPDLFVCFGVDRGTLESDVSYRIWDAGAPPSFVLEVASMWTHRRDRRRKPAVYLEVGVDEYWRFDATGGEFYTPMLQGDRRMGDRWAPIEVSPGEDGRLRGRSDALGLDLHAEPRRLRFRDPRTGRLLPDHDDIRERADAAEARADAEAAARRAAEAEAAALRARLNDQNGRTAP